ncbi:HAMP domain-containing protein [bacterium]|nr:HAMP domain-containing protein [bacterium]
MFKNVKLAPKLITIGGSLLLIPLLIIGFVVSVQTGASLRTSTNQQLLSKSRSIAELVDSTLQEEKKLTISTSISPEVVATMTILDSDGKEAAAENIKNLNSYFEKFAATKGLGEKTQVIAAVSKEGIVVAASAAKYGGVSIADRGYFKVALGGKANIGEAALNKVTGKPFISLAAPIYSSTNSIIGVLIHILDVGFINDIVIAEKFGESGYPFIIDKNGLTLAHPDPKHVMKTNLNDVEGLKTLIGKMNAQKTGIASYTFQGVEKSAGYARIESTDWGVGLTVSDAEFMKPIITLRNLIIGLSLISIVASLIIFFLFAFSLAKNIKKGVDFASEIALGNLNASIDIDQKDEIGDLAKAMSKMAGDLQLAISDISLVMGAVKEGDLSKVVTAGLEGDFNNLKESINQSIEMLSDTIVQVISNSTQVNVGSKELTDSAQSLAAGTTEQAASLEEIASSMNEIDAKTKTNDENAIQARQLISQTQVAVENGNSHMKTLLESIKEIKDTSTNVSKIIKDIDEIAFQTNLLALNAAVEAARAGKYGKGFAVVAEEVRNLAARSAKAAKNTTDLLSNSVNEVENGVEKADKAAEALQEINTSIIKVNDIIEEISESSKEQSSGIDEINKALTQVNTVIQNNSSISEETASASEELARQASNLQRLMNEFRIRQGEVSMVSKDDTYKKTPEKTLLIEPSRSGMKKINFEGF